MDILNDIATAAHLLGQVIADLDTVRLDPATPAAERDRIMMVLPRLRLRRRELDAEFDALVACGPMLVPSAEVVQRIRAAMAVLAEKVRNAQMADLALKAATDVVSAAGALRANG